MLKTKNLNPYRKSKEINFSTILLFYNLSHRLFGLKSNFTKFWVFLIIMNSNIFRLLESFRLVVRNSIW